MICKKTYYNLFLFLIGNKHNKYDIELLKLEMLLYSDLAKRLLLYIVTLYSNITVIRSQIHGLF